MTILNMQYHVTIYMKMELITRYNRFSIFLLHVFNDCINLHANIKTTFLIALV